MMMNIVCVVESEEHVLLDCNLYMRRRWKEKLASVNVDVYNAIKGYEAKNDCIERETMWCQKLFICCLLVLLLDSSHSLTPILGTLWIFPAGLDSIIVWTVAIAYMVVTMQMTWQPIRCS